MTKQFHALPMSWRCAKGAYPLVYLHDASISLADWLRFARRRSRGSPARAGLIAIRDCRGITHALFSYRVDLDLHARKCLCIADLIVAQLPGFLIDNEITASASQLAVNFGCQTISIERPLDAPAGSEEGCPTVKLLRSKLRVPPGVRQH